MIISKCGVSRKYILWVVAYQQRLLLPMHCNLGHGGKRSGNAKKKQKGKTKVKQKVKQQDTHIMLNMCNSCVRKFYRIKDIDNNTLTRALEGRCRGR